MTKQTLTNTPGKEQGTSKKRFCLKHLSGIWLGKTLMAVTRFTGRGGTTLPGRAALKLSPDIIGSLSRQLAQGSVLVTGTNGKTTTSYLLTGILQQAGYSCIHNQSGSNMSWGVASSLIDASTWGFKLPGDIGVLEVDEGAFPAVVQNVQPRGVVTTNIYRDQLDRYGEVDHIQKKIQKGLDALPEGAFQVLNADDPSLVGLSNDRGAKQWFYGLEMDLPEDRFQNTARDMKSCPHCQHELDYAAVYFAHLGRYRCPCCDFTRPEPQVKLTNRSITSEGISHLSLLINGQPLQAAYPLMGSYNLYNALAAATCAAALGVSPEAIKEGLEKAVPSFGRMERFIFEQRNLIMALIKNPVGANEVLRTLLELPGKVNLLVTINDKIADGTDISWLWDVDFEQLSALEGRLSSVIVSGIRAYDMAVRLKYAGLDQKLLQVEENSKQAITRGLKLTPPGETLFILPTYTAMLEMRGILNGMGVGRPYWEGAANG